MLIISNSLQCYHKICNKSQYMYGIKHKNARLGEVFVRYIFVFLNRTLNTLAP